MHVREEFRKLSWTLVFYRKYRLLLHCPVYDRNRALNVSSSCANLSSRIPEDQRGFPIVPFRLTIMRIASSEWIKLVCTIRFFTWITKKIDRSKIYIYKWFVWRSKEYLQMSTWTETNRITSVYTPNKNLIYLLYYLTLSYTSVTVILLSCEFGFSIFHHM